MKPLKFIHITKCAGTFIEDIGKAHNIKWGRHHKEYGFWHQPFTKKNKELKQKYDWFMIVRNPYSRIVSEYYCEWGGIGKKNVNHNKKQFNEYILKKIRTRDNYGGHFLEQHKYLDSTVTQHIVKLEEMNTRLPDLWAKYNIDISLDNKKKENTRQQKNKSLKFTRNDFNPEVIRVINHVYHEDFERFGYEKMNPE